MAAKRRTGSAQAVIEVWREGDRVLIGVPAAEVSAEQNVRLTPLPGSEAGVHRSPRVRRGRADEVLSPVERSARQQVDVGRVETEIIALTEEEWLVANLLALQREAVELTRSLDETRAYVAEKCAAVEKS